MLKGWPDRSLENLRILQTKHRLGKIQLGLYAGVHKRRGLTVYNSTLV